VLTVYEWTGVEARALRLAKRMSVRAFAAHLGIAVRTVTKWEAGGAGTTPRPDTQALLDTVLQRATAEEQARFRHLLRQTRTPPPAIWEERACDYETWADDLERAAVHQYRQDHETASLLLNKWLNSTADRHDDQGLYLRARSLVLLGDSYRDQGVLTGPRAACRTYHRALTIYSQLAIPRRIAQVQLALTLISEMSGELDRAARGYEELSADERLSPRDRARSLLWLGTTLSKAGRHSAAIEKMNQAVRLMEELDEVEDWSVAHQKLALAHRAQGNLDQAQRLVAIALANAVSGSPLQSVRLQAAHGHILLSDRRTCDHGLKLLDQAAAMATRYRLGHQKRSIDGIRRDHER